MVKYQRELLPLRGFPITNPSLPSSYLSFSGEIGDNDRLLENDFIGDGDAQKGMEAGFLFNVKRKSDGFSRVKSLPVWV